MKDFSETKPIGLYEAAIGQKNQDYYLDKFEHFDQQGPGFHASWNWAAFFFTSFWALYRKMYGWFFAWWAVGTVLTMYSRVQNSQINQILGIVAGVLWVAFSLYANSLYHRKIKARIAAAQKPNLDASRVSRRLSAGGGVHAWMPIVFGAIPVIGIVAAVALPAYQDYTKRQTVAASAVQTPVPQVDQVNPFPDPNFGKTAPAQSERGPWEEYQYRDGVAARARGDFASALPIFRTLAEQGYARAQGDLGVMYNRGDGVAQDYAESVKWYRLAAAQGNFNAQSNLGIMLLLGQGVPKDYIRGHMWLNIASTAGEEDSKKARDSAEVLMTPQQIAQAQQMARDCQQRNFKGCD